MTNGSLMKVESIAECSLWSILQYFWPALNDNGSWKPRFGLLLEWPLKTGFTIGITHVFYALTFARSRGSCLNTRPLGQVFKHRQRDLASVNAMKQLCVIVILAYFTWFQHKPCWKRPLNIKHFFLTLDFSKQNGVSVKLSNVITSLQRHI